MWAAGTENQRSSLPAAPVPGQLALVMVQVSPAEVSVQAERALAPAESPEILAPLITLVPSASLVTLITAESKLALLMLASVESYSSPWAAARRKRAACWAAPASA